MSNQTARRNILASMETRDSHDQAAREGAQLDDQPEQLYHAIDSAVKSAAMYRELNQLDVASAYEAKARGLVAQYRAIVKGN